MSTDPPRAPIVIGLELWTVRELFARDPAGTLAAVKAAGVQAIEWGYAAAGEPGTPAASQPLASQVDAIAQSGLVCVSVYLDPSLDYDAQLKTANRLGARFGILDCLPGMCEKSPATIEAVHAVAATLTNVGKRCRDQGLLLAYHPHWWEYRVSGRFRGIDLLLDQTDPALLALELDMGWAHVGGVDIAEMLHRYRGRIPLVHVKDRDPSRGGGYGHQFVTLGTGRIDYDTLIPVARATGVQHFLLETDAPENPMANIRGGVAWFKARPWL